MRWTFVVLISVMFMGFATENTENVRGDTQNPEDLELQDFMEVNIHPNAEEQVSAFLDSNGLQPAEPNVRSPDWCRRMVSLVVAGVCTVGAIAFIIWAIALSQNHSTDLEVTKNDSKFK